MPSLDTPCRCGKSKKNFFKLDPKDIWEKWDCDLCPKEVEVETKATEVEVETEVETESTEPTSEEAAKPKKSKKQTK